MITEFVCFKCKCEKCGHQWKTKSHEVPRVCAKCHSVKWNEGAEPYIESPQTASEPPKASNPIPDQKTRLEMAREALASIEMGEPVIEEKEEWTFTQEKATWEDGQPQRRQMMVVNGRPKYRIVIVDEYDENKMVKVR